MAKAVIVEGRYTCEHCDIDKSWIFSIEVAGMSSQQLAAEVRKCIKRQRTEVSDVSFPQPPHKLIYNVKYDLNKFIDVPKRKERKRTWLV